MALFNIIKDIHTQTKRDYLGRVVDFDKADCALIAKKFGFDYEYRLVGTGDLNSVFDEIDIQSL